MKILTSEEIRLADEYTIKHEPIKSVHLMERAAKACVDWIINFFGQPVKENKRQSNTRAYLNPTIIVVCGLGNNGGDGLAIARLLAVKKWKVEVYLVRYSDKRSADFLVNEKRLRKLKGVKIHNINSSTDFQLLIQQPFSTILVDALFGSGLNKPIEGLTAEVIKSMNKSGCKIISIDIPSGLLADRHTDTENDVIIRAAHTLTFQTPKLTFMFPEYGQYVGDFSILNIGLDEGFISSLPTKTYFIQKIDVNFLYRGRNKFSHKGTFGHALIVAGSYGKMGACILSGRACLSAGAGLVTVHIPKCGYEILQTINPEVMVETDSEEKIISDNIKIDKYNAIGIGTGIGLEKETQNALKILIQNSVVPLVLDADALNILSENKTWISFLPANSILTPHVGEFKRLLGNTDNSFERLQVQRDFSARYGVYIVLKGAHTCITCPDGDTYFNTTGNPGMATAGSGDVLTGILTGLLAQGYAAKQACIFGVYLHGLAGDLAITQDYSEESLIARNIIEFMGEAFKIIGRFRS